MGDFVYDIPARPLPGGSDDPMARNFRVLGKAVHPCALERLHELWPDAIVQVRHERQFGMWAGDTGWRSITRVVFYPRPGGRPIYAQAIAHPGDVYSRRYGIDLAFRRALKRLVAEGDFS